MRYLSAQEQPDIDGQKERTRDMIVAFLMGRKGSKAFPGKNLYKVLGKPLAYYPMQAARNCRQIDKTYITTDDEKLMQLARQNNIAVIKRPARLCTDKALGEDVYLHAYEYVKTGQEARYRIDRPVDV